ncbi:MAG: hypothetical protein IJ428_05785 [Clostridia bacterium]|nr:hypothetical protein [Clostridia bacterium]
MAGVADLTLAGVRLYSVTNGDIIDCSNIVSVKVDQSFDPISLTLPISTATVVVQAIEDIETVFSEGVCFCIYKDGHSLVRMYVESLKQTGKNTWTVTLQNIIGVLEDTNTALYVTNWGIVADKAPKALISSRALNLGSNVEFDSVYTDGDYRLTGFLPYFNKRDGLRDIAFATGAAIIIDPANGNKEIRFCQLSDEVQTVIPTNRVLSIEKIETTPDVKVIKCHFPAYDEEDVADEATLLYDASAKGPSDLVVFRHERPYISDGGNAVEVIRESSGYLVFSSESTGVIGGQACIDSGSDLYYGNLSNEEEMIDADSGVHTMVSQLRCSGDMTATKVLKRCYEYLSQGVTYRVKIAAVREKTVVDEREIITYKYNVSLGEVIQIDTEEYGTVVGRVIRMTYNLTNGIIVKNVELKKVDV